ncbi:hypothetical protein ACYZT8_19565 [Pseudomonas sp. LB3P93]
MDSIKAQAELNKIGLGNTVEIWGVFDGGQTLTNRIEKLLRFDTICVTVERPTRRVLEGEQEGEVLNYSAIYSIEKPESHAAHEPFGGLRNLPRGVR